MTELRIILTVMGAIILGAIYYLGIRKEKPKEKTGRDSIDSKIEPGFANSPSLRNANELPKKPGNITIDQAHEKLQKEGRLKQSEKNKIVTLFLHAKDGQQFDWHLIQSAADQVGLEFGKDNLYYRFKGFGEGKELIFMVANMLKPGIFQPDMRTTGLVLIMTLPGVMSALDMWDSMFPVGERIAKLLGGKLTDENHHIFSRQRIAAMRDEMRDFDQLQNQLQN